MSDDEKPPERDKALCSMCDEYGKHWWPAYDKTNPPMLYCGKHLNEAKQLIQLEGVPYMKMCAGYDEW